MTMTRRQVVAVILLGAFLTTELLFWWLARPAQMWVGSIGAQSLSVAWTSRVSNQGCVLLITKWWPLSSTRFCSRLGYKQIHLAEAIQLQPQTKYYVMWINGLMIDPFSVTSVSTLPLGSTPHRPVPLFGSVYKQDGGVVPQALVFVSPVNSTGSAAITAANGKGNWTIDGGVFGGRISDWHVTAVADVEQSGEVTYSTDEGYMPDIEVKP